MVLCKIALNALAIANFLPLFPCRAPVSKFLDKPESMRLMFYIDGKELAVVSCREWHSTCVTTCSLHLHSTCNEFDF